jgi:RHS repeat-associated protein
LRTSIYLPADGASYTTGYDVENRMVSTGGITLFYSYAPGNKRVWRGPWTGGSGSWTRGTDTITFYNMNGQKLGDYALTTISGMPQFYATETEVNYYFGRKVIKNGTGWVYSDRLKSIGKFFPYGGEISATTNGTEKFTGYFRDSETGLDYANNRYYTQGAGRFLTPDTKTGRADSPGTWNKYAYTGGDPINRVDPLGRAYCLGGDPTNCVPDEICDDPRSAFDPTDAYSAYCTGHSVYVNDRDVEDLVDTSGGTTVTVTDTFDPIQLVPGASDPGTVTFTTGTTTTSTDDGGSGGGSNLPSCFGNFIKNWVGWLNPFPTDDIPSGDFWHAGAKGLSLSFYSGALAHAGARVLPYPKKSRIFQKLVKAGDLVEGAQLPVWVSASGLWARISMSGTKALVIDAG